MDSHPNFHELSNELEKYIHDGVAGGLNPQNIEHVSHAINVLRYFKECAGSSMDSWNTGHHGPMAPELTEKPGNPY